MEEQINGRGYVKFLKDDNIIFFVIVQICFVLTALEQENTQQREMCLALTFSLYYNLLYIFIFIYTHSRVLYTWYPEINAYHGLLWVRDFLIAKF